MEQEGLFQQQEETTSARNAVEANFDKYLLFMSDNLLFGAKAENVVEIITNHSITHLPLVPHYILGIINLRGQIIPIIDVRILLGRCSPSENGCIIILNIDRTIIGIYVDTVQKMVDIDRRIILPTTAQGTQDLVSGMCSLEDGQTMMVLDCAKILSQP